MKLFIATGNSRREKHWNNTEIELEDLSSRLTNTCPYFGNGGAVPEAAESQTG